MKQRVKVTITTPSTAFNIKILAVHEVEGQLVVISEHNSGGWGADMISEASDAVVVSTSANKALPVLHYLTNVSKEAIEEDRHLGNYGKGYGYGSKDATDFTGVISDISEIQDFLAKGRCIYEPRKDGLVAQRLARCEKNYGKKVKPLLECVASVEKLEADRLKGVINIFPVVDDGSFKVVVEVVTSVENKKRFKNINEAFYEAVKQAGMPALDLKSSLLMVEDDNFEFNASVNGEEVRYKTGAYEFTLPANDIGVYLQFMRFLEEAVKLISNVNENEWEEAYTRIQVSHQSILSSFEELLISRAQSRHGQVNFIEYPELISVDEFAAQALPVEKFTATRLLTQAFTQAALPDYAGIQSVIAELFTDKEKIEDEAKQVKEAGIRNDGAAAIVYFPLLALERILGESIMGLRDPKVSMQEKQATVLRMQKKLLDRETFTKSASLLQHIQNSFVSSIMMACLGKPAHDKGEYNLSYTELNLLFGATFRLREDGRISMTYEGNPYYQKWYAEGRRNHDKLGEELLFLSNVEGVDLEFAEGCDFHQEAIFTEECSQRLIAQGVLLNAKYLGEQLALRGSEQQNAVLEEEDADVAGVEEAVIVPEIEDILNSAAAKRLRAKYPQSNAVIEMLQQAKVFTDQPYAVRHTLAQIFRAFAVFDERAKQAAEKDASKKSEDDGVITLYKFDAPEKYSNKKLPDTPESLVKLHRILLEHSLLTKETHKAVIGKIMNGKDLEKMALLIELIGPMNVKKAETVFKAAPQIIMIWGMIHCFDEDNKALLYMIDKIESARFYDFLWDMLACQQMDGTLEYLRPEDFMLMMDNLAGGKWHKILRGLGYLHKIGLIPAKGNEVDTSIRDRFLALEDFDLPLHELRMNDMLNVTIINLALDLHGEVSTQTILNLGYLQKAGILDEGKDFILQHQDADLPLDKLSRDKLLTAETLNYSLTNSDYINAEEFCRFASLTGWDGSIKKDHGEEAERGFKLQLLADPEVTRAICELREIVSFVRKRDKLWMSNGEEGQRYKSDLLAILTSAGIKLTPPQKPDGSSLSDCLKKGLVMFMPKPETLDECMARIKVKYKYEEPVLQLDKDKEEERVVSLGL